MTEKKNMVKKCEYCGEEYISNNDRKMYCKTECLHTAIKIRRRKDKVKRNCKYCGNEFETSHLIKMYCNDECYRKDKGIKEIDYSSKTGNKKRCICCGEEFISFSPQGMYCSKKCAIFTASYKRKGMEPIILGTKRAPINKICLFCGNEYISTNLMQVYCSVKCNKTADSIRVSERKRAIRLNSPEPLSNYTCSCKYCGKEFLSKKYKTYCDIKCYEKARSEIKRKHNSERIINKICKFCGKEFNDPKNLNKYCSIECHNSYIAQKQKEIYRLRKINKLNKTP